MSQNESQVTFDCAFSFYFLACLNSVKVLFSCRISIWDFGFPVILEVQKLVFGKYLSVCPDVGMYVPRRLLSFVFHFSNSKIPKKKINSRRNLYILNILIPHTNISCGINWHDSTVSFSLFSGLTGTSLFALSKLVSNIEVAEDMIDVIRQVVSQSASKNLENESIDLRISVGVWRVAGCHELLASLGFDLMEVGQDQVTLRTGKTANKRSIHFVLQALLALFGTYFKQLVLRVAGLSRIGRPLFRSSHYQNKN